MKRFRIIIFQDMSNKLTEINKETLIQNGFKVELENKERGNLWLIKSIRDSWVLLYIIQGDKFENFTIQANGGRDRNGEFDISNFKYIEQIDNLIDAMKGVINIFNNIEIDRKAVETLIKKTPPHYDLFENPLIKKAGHEYRDQGGYTFWTSLEDLTDNELCELYHTCKNSWN